MKSCITTDKLCAGYSGVTVFRDIDPEIAAGKITTLIGSNGSGKTTILKTMSRLITPLAGTACLDGQSIHSMPTKLVAQKLALLPQGAQTPSGITVSLLTGKWISCPAGSVSADGSRWHWRKKQTYYF